MSYTGPRVIEIEAELVDLGIPRGEAPDCSSKLLEFIKTQRRKGAGWVVLGAALGVPVNTLLSWDKKSNQAQAPIKIMEESTSIVPVHIVDEYVPVLTEPLPLHPGGHLAFFSPSGYRIEGLTLAEAAKLLEVLA